MDPQVTFFSTVVAKFECIPFILKKKEFNLKFILCVADSSCGQVFSDSEQWPSV